MFEMQTGMSLILFPLQICLFSCCLNPNRKPRIGQSESKSCNRPHYSDSKGWVSPFLYSANASLASIVRSSEVVCSFCSQSKSSIIKRAILSCSVDGNLLSAAKAFSNALVIHKYNQYLFSSTRVNRRSLIKKRPPVN